MLGGVEPQSEDGASLVARLELAYGSPAAAVHALRRALVLAGRSHVPDGPEDLVAFVHARLVPILIAEIGPRLTMALVDDLVADVAPISSTQPLRPVESVAQPVARVALRSRSSPPTKMALSVLLVDHDRVWRSMLARDLVRVRWGVSVIDAVVTAFPTVVLVARASNRATASALLESKGLHRFDVRAREEPAGELIEAVRRIVEG
jgi:hypothetical protein